MSKENGKLTIERLPTEELEGVPPPGGEGYLAIARMTGDRRRPFLVCCWGQGDTFQYSEVDPLSMRYAFNSAPPSHCDWLPEYWSARSYPLGPHAEQAKAWLDFVVSMVEMDKDAKPQPGTVPLDRQDFGWRALFMAASKLLNHVLKSREPLPDLPSTSEDALRRLMTIRDNVLNSISRPATPEPSTTTPPTDDEKQAEAKPDPFAELREYAKAKLRGKQQAILLAVCNAGGSMPFAKLRVSEGVDLENFKQFERHQTELNRKLNGKKWRIWRHNNEIHLAKPPTKDLHEM